MNLTRALDEPHPLLLEPSAQVNLGGIEAEAQLNERLIEIDEGSAQPRHACLEFRERLSQRILLLRDLVRGSCPCSFGGYQKPRAAGPDVGKANRGRPNAPRIR